MQRQDEENYSGIDEVSFQAGKFNAALQLYRLLNSPEPDGDVGAQWYIAQVADVLKERVLPKRVNVNK